MFQIVDGIQERGFVNVRKTSGDGNSIVRILLMGEEYINESENNLTGNSKEIMMNRKIFISHSSLDSKIVEKVIDVLEVIGVPSERIFCSSFEGYGVKLGADFLDVIKNELNNEVLVLFVLSNNFYSSIVSLCEMGATWVKTNKHIPILIPPFNYSDVKGVIPTTHGMKINEKEKYNTLKEVTEEFLSLKPLNFSVWERKRDKLLKEIKTILDEKNGNNPANEIVLPKEQETLDEFNFEGIVEKIKQLSKRAWPEDFEMQLHYIEKQTKALNQLSNHKPLDIDKEDFSLIRKKAKEDWPEDFEMQLNYEEKQVESLRRLKNM